MDVSGVLLAGGLSRRMGRPKPLAPFAGGRLVARPLAALRAVAREVLVLHGMMPDPALAAAVAPARLVADPGEGPLGAFVAAAGAARAPWIVVAPCDAPMLTPALLLALLSAARGHDAAAPVVEGVVQPLVAAYARDALACAAREARAAGERRAQDVFPRLDVVRLDAASLPGGADALEDADTPEALAALEARLGEKER